MLLACGARIRRCDHRCSCLQALEIKEDPAALLKSLDHDGSGTVDSEEMLNYLQEHIESSTATAMEQLMLGRQSSGGGTAIGGARRVSTEQEASAQPFQAGVSVIDRETKVAVKEFVPPWVLYGIKMQKSVPDMALRIALHRLTVSQGAKNRDKHSKPHIEEFIKEHNLERDCWDKKIEEYENFNDFFARGVKPQARPIAAPGDDAVAVSAADCRLTVFQTIDEATRLWVKGTKFSTAAVFGRQGQRHAKLFSSGSSLAIFRLSPQDYHRWHWPLSGTVGKKWQVGDALYTVNPEAIRNFNVYTENKRFVCELYTSHFGLVMMIVVGATVVGSISFLENFHEEGATVKKGDCHGYFGFGGSTVLLFFQPGQIKFDADLVQNSSRPVETLIRMGESIGRASGKSLTTLTGQAAVPGPPSSLDRTVSVMNNPLTLWDAGRDLLFLIPYSSVQASGPPPPGPPQPPVDQVTLYK